MQEPTYCQMNSNLPTVAQFTPLARPSRRGRSSPDDNRSRRTQVLWREVSRDGFHTRRRPAILRAGFARAAQIR
jgi:hypothetical protein